MRLTGCPFRRWLAGGFGGAIGAGSHRPGSLVRVRHGLGVVTRDEGFVEGAWDAPFEAGGFDRSAVLAGSGGKLTRDGVLFASPANVYERLHSVRVDDTLVNTRSGAKERLHHLASLVGGAQTQPFVLLPAAPILAQSQRRVFGPAIAALLVLGTVGYQLVEGWGWFDALYMTAITITTVGFLEVHPMGAGGRVFTMVLALGGVFTAFYAAAEFIRAVVTGEIRTVLGRQRMESRLEKLSGHFVVCGLGRMGRLVAEEFSSAGLPFVVIDRDPKVLEGFDIPHGIPLVGDATADDVLRRAGVERAPGRAGSSPPTTSAGTGWPRPSSGRTPWTSSSSPRAPGTWSCRSRSVAKALDFTPTVLWASSRIARSMGRAAQMSTTTRKGRYVPT